MDKSLLKKATADTADPTPGYMFPQCVQMASGDPAVARKVADFLFSRLKTESPRQLTKTLQVMRHIAHGAGAEAQAALRSGEHELRALTTFKGASADPQSQAVRDGARAALEACYKEQVKRVVNSEAGTMFEGKVSCPAGHQMTSNAGLRGVMDCNYCAYRGAPDGFVGCRKCDVDMCTNCARTKGGAAEMRPATAGSDGCGIDCGRRHGSAACLLCRLPYREHNGHQCKDGRRGQFPCSPTLAHSEVPTDQLPPATMLPPGGVQCPAGHKMAPRIGNIGISQCDVCGQKGKPSSMFACRSCDYDLCGKCATTGRRKETQATGYQAVQIELNAGPGPAAVAPAFQFLAEAEAAPPSPTAPSPTAKAAAAALPPLERAVAEVVGSSKAPGRSQVAKLLRDVADAEAASPAEQLHAVLSARLALSLPWQQRVNALIVLEALLRDGHAAVTAHFRAAPGDVQRNVAVAQTTLRDRAKKVLQLLGVDPASAAGSRQNTTDLASFMAASQGSGIPGAAGRDSPSGGLQNSASGTGQDLFSSLGGRHESAIEGSLASQGSGIPGASSKARGREKPTTGAKLRTRGDRPGSPKRGRQPTFDPTADVGLVVDPSSSLQTAGSGGPDLFAGMDMSPRSAAGRAQLPSRDSKDSFGAALSLDANPAMDQASSQSLQQVALGARGYSSQNNLPPKAPQQMNGAPIGSVACHSGSRSPPPGAPRGDSQMSGGIPTPGSRQVSTALSLDDLFGGPAQPAAPQPPRPQPAVGAFDPFGF